MTDLLGRLLDAAYANAAAARRQFMRLPPDQRGRYRREMAAHHKLLTELELIRDGKDKAIQHLFCRPPRGQRDPKVRHAQ
jgi:hypothetical protein